MCGIAGLVCTDPRHPVDPGLLSRMTGVIRHRGPDADGFHRGPGVGLGHRRLSIIDLSTGDQPIYNETRTVAVVFNGEIYNFAELAQELEAAGHTFATRSDTETIVHAWEARGPDALDDLEGMFGLAVWNDATRTLVLARDRLGIKPLYYAVLPEGLVFASELKAMFEHPGVSRELDMEALSAYLAHDWVPAPRSMLKSVRKLPPGHRLSYAGGEARVERWWDVRYDGGESMVEVQAAAKLGAVLDLAVRQHLLSDVPLGVFLSGGIDSSAVAAMMTELGGEVKSFSVGFAERSFDESAHAREVAAHLGTDHHELTLEPGMLLGLIPKLPSLLDEPLGDASIIPTYLLSEFTRRHVKVALGGDGGDELFVGYPTLQAHRLAGYYLRAPALRRRAVVEPLVQRLPVSRGNLSFDFRAKRFVSGAAHPVAERHRRWMGSFASEERTALLSREVRASLGDANGGDEFGSYDPLNQVLMMDMRLYLENDILVKLDRTSMMASLEGRVPLLNNDFVAYATSLPLRMKLRGMRSKFLLKRALRGVLPDRILNRPKKGFGIPVAEWFRGPLKEQMLSVLAPDRLSAQGFFEPRVVRELIDDHLAGRRDNRKQLWTLFAFQLWHEGYASLA